MRQIVLDTETTGLEVAADRVVSLGEVCAHGTRLFKSRLIDELIDLIDLDPEMHTLSFLPINHVFEQVGGILLPLSIAGEKPDADWYEHVVETVGLGDRLTHRPSELSGGQQQRVAVARALVGNPSLILADEPTGNLDTGSGTDVLSLLVDLWKQGSTLMVVTHDPAIAKRADRIIEIRDGLIEKDSRAA